MTVRAVITRKVWSIVEPLEYSGAGCISTYFRDFQVFEIAFTHAHNVGCLRIVGQIMIIKWEMIHIFAL